MQYVWIQYYPGDCGTFFAWFVNQHKGFLENRLPFKINDPVKNEVICDPMMWEWRDHDFYDDFITGRIIDDRTEEFDEWGVRISFKTFPEHCWQAQDDELWGEPTDEYPEDHMLYDRYVRMKKIRKELTTVCLVTSPKHRQHFVDRMAACFDTYPEDTETGETKTAEDMYAHRDQDYAYTLEFSRRKFPECNHFQIDIGELLYELNDLEYLKLCNELDLEPNPHWKILMQFYRYQVFENY